MDRTEPPRNEPDEQHEPDDQRGDDVQPGAPTGTARGGVSEEAPSYDAARETYAGISASALVDIDDVGAARELVGMIVDTIREGLLILDLDLRVKAVNESFYQMFEVEPEETVGRLVYDLGDGQWDIPELRRLLEEILPHDKAFDDYEVDHEFEGLGHRVMLLNGRRLDHSGLILLAIEDLTDRHMSERELRESEERYRSVSESGVVAIAFFDTAGAITVANDAFLDLVGYTREELEAGRVRWDRLTPPEWMARTWAAVEEYKETGRIEPYEKEYFRKGGERFWGLFGGRRIESTGEGVAFVLDITERKRAEEALRASEERTRRAQQAAHVGTWDLDLATGAVSWSEGVFDLVGLPPQGGVPSTVTWAALLHPYDRERVLRQVQEVIETGGAYESEFRVVRPDGEVVWIAAKGHVLSDETGRPARLLGANYDVTARKRTEEALRGLNETLEERVGARTRQVRELSRALALAEQEERRRIAQVLHDDLQQVLFGAKVAASLGNAGDLEGILNEAIELTRTLSHALSPPFLEGEDVEDLLRWVAERQRMRYGLEVEVEASGDVPVPDLALRVLLYQVVRELLFNVAKHAGTERAHLQAARVDDHVRVVVEDKGVGFEPAGLEEAGTVGMGLRNVRERVELVGGRMEIESAPGDGTRVTIVVPVKGEAAEGE